MLGAVCEEFVITVGLDGDSLAESEAEEMQVEESCIDDEVFWIQVWSDKQGWKCGPDTGRCRCLVVFRLLSVVLPK